MQSKLRVLTLSLTSGKIKIKESKESTCNWKFLQKNKIIAAVDMCESNIF